LESAVRAGAVRCAGVCADSIVTPSQLPAETNSFSVRVETFFRLQPRGVLRTAGCEEEATGPAALDELCGADVFVETQRCGLEDVAEGNSRRGAARRFKVGASSAIRWKKQLDATGAAAPAELGQ
jgi:hypothetical protein